MTAKGGAVRRSRGAVDLALILMVLWLIGLTTVVMVVPTMTAAVVNDRFDITILTAATLVAGAVAASDWARAGDA